MGMQFKSTKNYLIVSVTSLLIKKAAVVEKVRFPELTEGTIKRMEDGKGAAAGEVISRANIVSYKGCDGRSGRAMLLFLLLSAVSRLSAEPLSDEENSYLQEMCGHRDESLGKRVHRSMNTPNARRDEAPWAVLLKYTNKWHPDMDVEQQFDESRVHCTGVLVSSRHILTAAHCFGPLAEAACGLNDTIEILDISMHRRNLDRFLVVAPEVCVGLDCPSDFSPRGLKINKVFLSSRYILGGCIPKIYRQHEGDIAVVELQRDVALGSTVFPACLSDEPLPPQTNLTMFGYGRSHLPPAGILRRHEAVSKEECTVIRGVDEHIVCSTHPVEAACSGDSGAGQIVFRENGTAHVVAVLIAGIPCPLINDLRNWGGEIESEDINVSIHKHARWICEVSGICPSGRKILETTEETPWQRILKLIPGTKSYEEPKGFVVMEKLQGDDLYA